MVCAMETQRETDLAATVQDVLEASEGIVLAYLFGSVAKGCAGPLSDIDIAVLADRDVAGRDVLGTLTDDLCRRLRTDCVDLIDLAKAPSHLAYHVIRDGRCLLCGDRRVKESFEVRTSMTYLDFKPVRERAFATARRAILEAV